MDATELLDATCRAHHARMFAALVASLGDMDRAEEALQEAYAQALVAWPEGGAPDRPAAWLVAAARRRGVDRARRDSARSRREHGAGEERARAVAPDAAEVLAAEALPDERLRLLFTCCHPALAKEAQVALTLRAVSGLSTEAIAHAFLVPTETMAQRLVRAKKKIREARIPFVLPPPEHLEDRLSAVSAVVYLVFNEGYAASEGPAHVRHDLCAEAVTLADLLVELSPEHGEAHGLLALLQLLDARRETRVDAEGLPLLLADQDRTRWDRDRIQRGVLSIGAALRRGELGPYGLQAAIAAAHAEAEHPEDTPWARILVLYDKLQVLAPTPVVRLNRVAAAAMVHGPDEALSELDRLQSELPVLDSYVWTHTLRAELSLRSGAAHRARASFDRAVDLASTDAQRAHIRRRMGEL